MLDAHLHTFLARKIYTFNETFSFFTKSLPTLLFPQLCKATFLKERNQNILY